MQRYSDLCLHISLWSCDMAHLLGPALIASSRRLRTVRTAVFPEFVPVSLVPRREAQEQYILLVGAPWYLKGADLLIAAFLRLAGDFPGAKLKLVGWFPDCERLEALAGGSTGHCIGRVLGVHGTLVQISDSGGPAESRAVRVSRVRSCQNQC